jgi:hypothetical protein
VIANSPPLPISFLFSRCVGRAIPEDDPALAARPLEEFAIAAGIPVLRAAPDSTDPPLWLRILVAPSPPDRETAEALARAGAWIDVHLADSESIALAGRGIRVAPIEAGISLLDVAPTALHLLGLAVPRTCDGRVIAEALDPSQITARAPRYRS